MRGREGEPVKVFRDGMQKIKVHAFTVFVSIDNSLSKGGEAVHKILTQNKVKVKGIYFSI